MLQVLGFILFAYILGATADESLNSVTVSYDPLRSNWQNLPYDEENYMCTWYGTLCGNFLDEIGCDGGNRTVTGCNPTLANFGGICRCNGNPVYVDMGSRVQKQIMDNRIKSEIGWMLEPWSAGPPYSFSTSYVPICQLTLHRLGCPVQNQSIAIGSQNGVKPYVCSCGKFTVPSFHVEELICDKLNEARLMELPIFSDPVTLSVELSLAFVMVVGKISSLIATILRLPPIIGFLLGGVAIQDITSNSLIKGAGGDGPHSTPFGEIRILALIIVLMRAGMTLKTKEIVSKGYMAIAMSFIPYFCEFAALMGVGMQFFHWSPVDMGLLASILAALSPSIVIPSMIKLVDEKLGYTPKLVLTAAPIEVVLAIILYNIFASLEQNTTNTLYPWISVLPIWANIVLIPVNIAFSTVLGYMTGFAITKYIEFRESCNYKFVNDVLPKSIPEYLFACIVGCYTLYALCQPQYLQQSSGILAVFVSSLTVSKNVDPAIIEGLKTGLAGLWVFLEVLLFTTTGINLSFKSQTGPLQSERGITQGILEKVVGMIFVGSLGRSAGILGLVLIGFKTLKPHRQNMEYTLLWWIATWFSQIPKATVQATLGGLPLSQHVIPGPDGLTKGLFILQVTAFSVLLMATIGVFLTNIVGKPIMLYLESIDRKEGYDENDELVEKSDDFEKDGKKGDNDANEITIVDGIELTALAIDINDKDEYDPDAAKSVDNPDSPCPPSRELLNPHRDRESSHGHGVFYQMVHSNEKDL